MLTCFAGSGVQIGPNIVDRVSKLYTWFRNKTYILPPPNQVWSAKDGANFKCEHGSLQRLLLMLIQLLQIVMNRKHY